MFSPNLLRRASLVLVVPALACAVARQTPQPGSQIEQLSFEIQTPTPTIQLLADAPTYTPDPNITPTPAITATQEITATQPVTTDTATAKPEEAAGAEAVVVDPPTLPPPPTPTVPLAEPLRGGEWDFEAGFQTWANPHGDSCPGSGLAIGWTAFTTRDQFGSSCMNQTTWQDNVYSGENAQEITFAYVGSEAGVYKTAPTIPGHRYTVEAYFRREFSPAKVEISLGIDVTGNQNWQAETVQWFPWDEDFDDRWSRTEETVTATGQSMTIFIKGRHPYPEPGGTLRIDSISVVDIGPE